MTGSKELQFLGMRLHQVRIKVSKRNITDRLSNSLTKSIWMPSVNNALNKQTNDSAIFFFINFIFFYFATPTKTRIILQ